MGKRSRKRGDVEASATTRAERDAARARRAAAAARSKEQGARSPRPGRTSIDDRPPAPWGSFPLVELVVLVGIVLLVVGFIMRGERGVTMIIAGMALASLGGLELSIREHFAGFRSHTSLLAGAIALAAIGAAYLLSKDQIAMVSAAAIAFIGAFFVFRRVFVHRSGGVAF